MENITEIKTTNEKKPVFKSRRFWILMISILIGGTGGFLYYHFVGCVSGRCAITSNPYMSIFMGGLLGYLISDSFFGKRK
jgi:hypothetical protein